MESRWVKKGKVVGPFGWFATVTIFLFLFITGSIIAVNVWYQTSLKAPGGGQEKVFVVKKGDSVEELARRLKEEGLIKNALAFRIFLITSKLDAKIEAGSFKLNSNQNAEEVARELQHGRLDKWITLVEGLRVEEIASKIAREFGINEKKFIKLAKEGYMFPDTYLIPVDASEEKIVSVLRENFDKKVGSSIKTEAEKNGLTFEKLINLASIVERESVDDDQRPIIAGVLLKRLNEGWRLEADATIQYALGFQKDQKTWWKKSLTSEDLGIDSPYNTRKVLGLPPTPICNPGLSAIKAVASPRQSPYYYYLHDKDGKVHFAQSLEEHNSNKKKYLK